MIAIVTYRQLDGNPKHAEIEVDDEADATQAMFDLMMFGAEVEPNVWLPPHRIMLVRFE